MLVKTKRKNITMKKYKLLILSALFIISVLYISSDYVESTAPIIENLNQNINEKTTKNDFLIKNNNNKICVYRSFDNEIITIIESPSVSELPIADQTLLNEGISAVSLVEVQQILEDYDYNDCSLSKR